MDINELEEKYPPFELLNSKKNAKLVCEYDKKGAVFRAAYLKGNTWVFFKDVEIRDSHCEIYKVWGWYTNIVERFAKHIAENGQSINDAFELKRAIQNKIDSS